MAWKGSRPPPRREKLWLTERQERTVRRMVTAGSTRDEVAFELGISPRLLAARLEDQLADLRVGQGKGGGRPRAVRDPTPEEIAERSAQVRRRWPLERWLGHLDRDG